MKHRLRLIALAFAGVFATAGALAEKPSWAGNGKPDKHAQRLDDRRGDRGNPDGRRGERDDRRRGAEGWRFDEESRRVIFDYYGAQARRGHCPPGLAKKHNGCLPPGQAKKWQRGYPLPSHVVYHDLPRDILLRLPPPPPRHRYVQIAGDILLIAIGTGMVVDAVEDILR